MKKKLLMILLTLVLAFSFVGCSVFSGDSDERTEKDDEDEDEDDEDEDDEDEDDDKKKDDDEDDRKKDDDEDDDKKKDDKDDDKKKESSEAASEPVETPEPTPEATPEATPTPAPEATPVPGTQPGEPAAQATPAPTELSNDLYSFQVSINGVIHQFPMWYSDFEALGWTFRDDSSETLSSNQYSVADVWLKDDIKVYSTMANLSINTAPYTNCMVAGISLEKSYLKESGWEIVLPGGITYGVSTKDDIIAAYGDPSSDFDSDLYYKMAYELDYHEYVNLYVYKDSGVLEKIEIENIIELEGADNSVDPTVPDIVKNYVAPTEVGDDLYQFNFELEGNLYTLPCPVSELLANGFTINENNSDSVFPANGYGWVEFRYNNQTYFTIVENYADYATTAENCFVTSMTSSIYDPDFALTIPCGITRGMTEEEILELIKDFNYTTSTSSGFTYYKIRHPEGDSLDGFDITIKDGEVIIIEIANDEMPEN